MKLYVFSYVNWSSGYYLLSTICWNPLIFLLGYHWYSSSFCYYVFIPLLCFLLFFFFKFCFFTLQYCVGFAIHWHESTAGVAWVPNPEPLFHRPPHIISLGHPSALWSHFSSYYDLFLPTLTDFCLSLSQTSACYSSIGSFISCLKKRQFLGLFVKFHTGSFN